MGLAAFGLVLALPSIVWGLRARAAGPYPIEYGYLVLALLATRATRARVAARRIFVGLYALTLLFLVYEHLFPAFFRHEPALVEDWKLAINLYHFLAEMKTWRWSLLGASTLAGATLVLVLLGRVLRAAQTHLEASRRQLLAAGRAQGGAGERRVLAHGQLDPGPVADVLDGQVGREVGHASAGPPSRSPLASDCPRNIATPISRLSAMA